MKAKFPVVRVLVVVAILLRLYTFYEQFSVKPNYKLHLHHMNNKAVKYSRMLVQPCFSMVTDGYHVTHESGSLYKGLYSLVHVSNNVTFQRKSAGKSTEIHDFFVSKKVWFDLYARISLAIKSTRTWKTYS